MNENQSEMDKRLSSFGCDRFEYKVNLLPLPRDKETILEIRDYDLYPFNYTTEPLPMDDSPYYNRALIQAIQIQSSWAVPKSEPKPKAVFQEKFVAEEPPIRNPIHIGCPSVSGLYLNAKIVQHVIEPSLIQAISNGKEIVDLTGSLLKQGISHWKHSNRTIQFHAPPKHPKNTHIPFFPTDTTYEYARIGCQIVSLGDLVTIGSGTELKLSKIFCRNNDLMLQGKLYESGDILTVHVKEFRQRFDPCFDIALLFNIQAQCDWNGDPIYRGEARVNFK